MRKIVMAAGLAALVGGTALAAGQGEAPPAPGETPAPRAAPVVPSVPPNVHTYRLDRWGFDAKGPTESQAAYRHCPEDRLVSVNSRRNAGDWATAVVTLGWYTPAHVDVRCAPPPQP